MAGSVASYNGDGVYSVTFPNIGGISTTAYNEIYLSPATIGAGDDYPVTNPVPMNRGDKVLLKCRVVELGSLESKTAKVSYGPNNATIAVNLSDIYP